MWPYLVEMPAITYVFVPSTGVFRYRSSGVGGCHCRWKHKPESAVGLKREELQIEPPVFAPLPGGLWSRMLTGFHQESLEVQYSSWSFVLICSWSCLLVFFLKVWSLFGFFFLGRCFYQLSQTGKTPDGSIALVIKAQRCNWFVWLVQDQTWYLVHSNNARHDKCLQNCGSGRSNTWSVAI